MSATAFTPRRLDLQRRIAAVLLLAVGAFLVSITLAYNLFKVGPAFENLITDFRPHLTQSSIDTARGDIGRLQAASTELQTKVMPALAGQLGMSQAQFGSYLQQQFPAVTKGLAALPQITPQFTATINDLDQNRPLFRSADAIPTKNLPATTVPWSLLGVGILVMGLGVATWFTRRWGAGIAGLAGVLVVVGAFAMSLPGKAADADQLNANLKPTYTQAMVDQAKGAVATVSAMGTEMQTKMLPAMATALKMDPATLQTMLAQNFPATAAALSSMPASLARFDGLVSAFSANLGNYGTLKPVPFERIIWMLVASGSATALLGGWAFVASRERRRPELIPPVEERIPVGAGR